MGHLSVFQGNERVREKWKRARRMVSRQKKKSRKRSQIERTPAYMLAFKIHLKLEIPKLHTRKQFKPRIPRNSKFWEKMVRFASIEL